MTACRSPFEAAAIELRALGLTLTQLPGEYRINYRHGADATAQIAETLAEALAIGHAMAAARPPTRPRRRWRKARRRFRRLWPGKRVRVRARPAKRKRYAPKD